jgi:hypothetical protein
MGRLLHVKDIMKTPKETLEPKPPEFLQHIKWFCQHGRENKLFIVIAIVILLISVLVHHYLSGSPNENVKPPIMPKFVTISSNEIVLSGPGTYLVDTENKASSDSLKKIYGLSEGDKVTLKAADDDRTIVIKKGHYLKMPADFSLDNEDDFIILISKGSNICAQYQREHIGD